MLFRPPLGWLMRSLGGTPVVRESPQGAVAQAVAMLEAERMARAARSGGSRSSRRAATTSATCRS
jgi:hypothetical protein